MQITEAAEVLEAEIEVLIKDPEKKRVAEATGLALQALHQWESNLDIEYDYKLQAKQLKKMVKKYETASPALRSGGILICPECRHRVFPSVAHCANCGKKLDQGAPERRRGKGKK